MSLIILKTNIDSWKVPAIEPILDFHSSIESWSIDTEDIDNVLRIEAKDEFGEADAIELVNCFGFCSEPMDDNVVYLIA